MIGNEIADRQGEDAAVLFLEHRLSRLQPHPRRVAAIHSAILRNQAAAGDAGIFVQMWQHRFESLAADIFVINIDTIGAGRRQGARQVCAKMRDAGIEAQFAGHVGAFFVPACNADDAAAEDFSHLSHHLANAARCGGNHHGFTSLGLALHYQAGIGGKAQHTQHADGGSDRRHRGVQFSRDHIGEVGNTCPRQAMALPTIGVEQ